MPRSFSDMTSVEYRDEDSRIEKFRRGDLRIGDKDMARLFDIQPAPVYNAFYVRQIRGVNPVGTQAIPADSRIGTPAGTNANGKAKTSRPHRQQPRRGRGLPHLPQEKKSSPQGPGDNA